MSNLHKSRNLFSKHVLLHYFDTLVHFEKQITLHLQEANIETR